MTDLEFFNPMIMAGGVETNDPHVLPPTTCTGLVCVASVLLRDLPWNLNFNACLALRSHTFCSAMLLVEDDQLGSGTHTAVILPCVAFHRKSPAVVESLGQIGLHIIVEG